MNFIKHKILILFGFMLFSSIGAANESDTTFEEFSNNPANYCFGRIEPESESFKARWELLTELLPRSILGELMWNPYSPSLDNVVTNVAGNFIFRRWIKDADGDILDDGNVWLHSANAKHYGAVGVTHGANAKGDFISHRYTYFEGNFAYLPAFSAYVWGGCIPSIEVFRSLGYQLELGVQRTSKQTTQHAKGFFMFASTMPVFPGSQAVQYNYYLPPGGQFNFWDAERGVMPRTISFAGYDNPDPFFNNSHIDYHEKTGDPIFREVRPSDFEGFAPGGYELHLYLKDRMMKASEEFMSGRPVAEIAADVRRDVAAFKSTLPPVPENFLPPTKIYTKETFKEEDLGPPDLEVVQHIKFSDGSRFNCWFFCKDVP